MADVDFRIAAGGNDDRDMAQKLLQIEALQEEMKAQHDQTTKLSRGVGAGLTILASGTVGMFTEGATMADLAILQAKNPAIWSSYGARDLSSVRGALAERPSWMSHGEIDRLNAMSGRGVLKGVAAGAAGLAGSIAVDAMFFSDTKRTGVSMMTDTFGLPLVSLLPVNPYMKTAAIVTAHTLGRLYDKYYA